MLRILIRDHRLRLPGVGIGLVVGDTVPSDGTRGYAQGALFMLQGAAWYESLWVNKGNKDSAAFTPVNIVT